MRCIIFVQKVITAIVLRDLLNTLLPKYNSWKTKFIAGQNFGLQNTVANENKNEVADDRSSDLEKEQKEGNEEVSDTETVKDSVSSQGDSFTNEDERTEKALKDPKSKVKVNPSESNRGSKERSDRKTNKFQSKVSNSNQKSPHKQHLN